MKTGIVTRKALGRYAVVSGGETWDCGISSKLLKELVFPIADPSSLPKRVVAVKGIKSVDPVAVGDEVEFTEGDDGTGMIMRVLPRRTKLSRLAAGPKPVEQVIVANIDQVVIVVAAAKPKPKWNLLDRYLVNAEASSVPALVCITKMDLVDETRFRRDVGVYLDLGYRLIFTSAIMGTGIEEMRDALKDRASVLAGISGVGKTTLINTLQPGLGLRVREVSKSTGKGMHATTWLEMFDLDLGGRIIDTPGMREFGLWNVPDEDLPVLFPEMRPYVGRCRFGLSCSHTHEPGCAIKEAVEEGEILERRYRSYLNIRE
jgi:ribosome biogenesis GTPase